MVDSAITKIYEVEIEMFTEHVHSYIKEKIHQVFEEVSSNIVLKAQEIDVLKIIPESIDELAHATIIKPYTELLGNLISSVNKTISIYFELIELEGPDFHPQGKLFKFDLSSGLLSEQIKTVRFSEVVEKLIDKALDLTVISRISIPYSKKVFAQISPGKRLMKLACMDSASTGSRSIKHIETMLYGINKNTCIQLRNSLLKHYSELIYSISDSFKSNEAFEQVI